MDRAYENDTSAQSHEDSVSQLAPSDRGRFQTTENMRQISRLKARKFEDDFFKWNNEFMELSECLEMREYITCEKPYTTTQEILCDRMAG